MLMRKLSKLLLFIINADLLCYSGFLHAVYVPSGRYCRPNLADAFQNRKKASVVI